MTASPISTGRQRLALDRIAIPGNVRELDSDHIDALAASIILRGPLVPVIVRPAGAAFELVAGFHRFAAHKQLGEKYIEVDVRNAGEEHADRAIESVARWSSSTSLPGRDACRAISPSASTRAHRGSVHGRLELLPHTGRQVRKSVVLDEITWQAPPT